MESFFTDIALPAAYVLIGLAVIGSFFLPLIKSFSNPKSLLKSFVGVALIVVVFLIGYSMSDNIPNPNFGVTEGISQVLGGSIITMYILFAVAIVGIVFTEISKIFR